MRVPEKFERRGGKVAKGPRKRPSYCSGGSPKEISERGGGGGTPCQKTRKGSRERIILAVKENHFGRRLEG